MTPKQTLFAQGLAAGKTQSAAYIDAGYSARGKTAAQNASVLAKNPDIQDYVARILDKGLQRATVTAGDVIAYLGRVMAEGIEEGRKSNGTRFSRVVGTAHRIRAAELLGRMYKLWADGPVQPQAPQGFDYSKLSDAELAELERMANKAAGAHVGAGELVVIHPVPEPGAHVGAVPEVLNNGPTMPDREN